MKIMFDEVPEEGTLDVEFFEDEGALNDLFREGLEKDYHFASPVKGSFNISKQGKTVIIALEIKGSVTVTCSRCLVEFEYPLESSSRLTLFPYKAEAGKEMSLDEEGADRSYYYEAVLKLDKILKEETALLLPFNPLCGEDCQGLCNSCGKSLNRGPCNCKKEVSDKRFEILKNLKLK